MSLSPAHPYQHIEGLIRSWAMTQKMVRAIAVIGSQARTVYPADTWSDLDLILVVSDAQPFLEEDAWLDRFGEVWLKVLQTTGPGMPEWLVLYRGGLKVDFLLVETAGSAASMLYGPALGHVSRRGLRMLMNKGEEMLRPPSSSEGGEHSPCPQAFAAAVALFWITAQRVASLLARGDLWRARQVMDTDLRAHLVQMLAWHAQSQTELEADTWYEGRFLEAWADPRALAAIPGLFAAYKLVDSERSLREMLALYAWLAEETAARNRHPYPAERIARVRTWIELALEEIV